jgi:hypothetical protein
MLYIRLNGYTHLVFNFNFLESGDGCHTIRCLIGVVIAYFLATRQFRGKNVYRECGHLADVLAADGIRLLFNPAFGRNGVIGRAIYRLTGWSLMFSWHGAVAAAFVRRPAADDQNGASGHRLSRIVQ